MQKQKKFKTVETGKQRQTSLLLFRKNGKQSGLYQENILIRYGRGFRTACDKFFNSKSDFFSNVDEEQEENLKIKKELIQEIKDFMPGDDEEETISTLKEFQNKWAEIGFVPIQYKNELQDEFRNALNEQFDKLNMDDFDKNIQRYKAKIDSFPARGSY